MNQLLPLMVALPLGTGFLIALLPGNRPRAGDALAVAAGAAMLAGAFALLNYEGQYYIGGWQPPVGINLTLDGFSALLLATAALVTFAVILFSVRYMELYTSRPRYFAMLMLMAAGMNGVLLSGDIFNRFVYVEIAAIASYVLVGFGCATGELKAALKYAVLGALASVTTLMAIALLYALYGTVNIAHLAEKIGEPVLITTSVTFMAAVLMLTGFGFKSAIIPLHIWQPDALEVAPAPVSAMIAGILIEIIGIYAMMRTVFAVFGITEHLGWIMLGLGLVSMTAGAAIAFRQTQYRRFLAYNSISQIGYVLCGFGAGGMLAARGGADAPAALAITGAVFHLAAHAVSKTLLFLNTGAARYSAGGLRDAGSCDVGYESRTTALAGLAGSLSSAGAPPFAGFASKAMIIVAFAAAGYHLLAVLSIATAILTFAAFFRFHRDAYRRVRAEGVSETGRGIPVTMTAVLAGLSVLCLAMGLLALPRYRPLFLEPAAESIIHPVGSYSPNRLRAGHEEQD